MSHTQQKKQKSNKKTGKLHSKIHPSVFCHCVSCSQMENRMDFFFFKFRVMTKYAEVNMIILTLKKIQENSILHAEDMFDVIQLK